VRHILTAFIIAVGVLAGSASVIAHHGAATFATGTKLELQGTVTEWVWSNPHCFLKFDVTEKDGSVRHWTVETSNPPDMVNRGWSRRSFKGGEKVTVVVEPVKSGNPVGRLLSVTFADGKVLRTQG
jgi:hypothetical protein